jgi:hypothetical protein
MTDERRRIYEALTLNAAADLCDAIEEMRGTESITIRRNAEGRITVSVQPRIDRARTAIQRMVEADQAMREPVR